MARTLTPPSRPAVRRALLAALGIALLAHAAVLGWVSVLLQPPSLLRELAQPMYTRTLQAEAPAPTPDAVATQVAANSAPNRPSAHILPAPAAIKNKAKNHPKPAPKSARAASAAAEDQAPTVTDTGNGTAQAGAPDVTAPADSATPGSDSPDAAAQIAAAQQAAASAPAQAASAAASAPSVAAASPPEPTASAPAVAASGAVPAFVQTWPGDTRLSYQLSGNYRGELHGSAQVLWQREGTRYQAVVQMDLGILLSSRFTSQGAITEQGLHPEVYEEQVRQRRRGVRIGEDVRLNNGNRVPRPNAVQDAASQFVELGHRFATGQVPLRPGGQVNFWLARPGGVDEWTYDILGEETLQLPTLGAVQAVHLRPRQLAKPRGSIVAEIWFAPSLQYLPVRIRITQGEDSYVDLLVQTIDQR